MTRFKTTNKKIKQKEDSPFIGKTFRKVIADGNPLWKVIERYSGKGEKETYVIQVVEAGDFEGHREVISAQEINAFLGFENMWANIKLRCSREWKEAIAKLPVGSFIHECEDSRGEGKFVRYELLENGALKAIALLGDWNNDLPRYFYNETEPDEQHSGRPTLLTGYHVEKVLKGEEKVWDNRIGDFMELGQWRLEHYQPAKAKEVRELLLKAKETKIITPVLTKEMIQMNQLRNSILKSLNVDINTGSIEDLVNNVKQAIKNYE